MTIGIISPFGIYELKTIFDSERSNELCRYLLGIVITEMCPLGTINML